MLPFRLFVQDTGDDASIHFVVPKDTFIEEMTAGEFDLIAIFEIIGEPFQQAMDAYVRQLLRETDQAITVVVLVEKASQG